MHGGGGDTRGHAMQRGRSLTGVLNTQKHFTSECSEASEKKSVTFTKLPFVGRHEFVSSLTV